MMDEQNNNSRGDDSGKADKAKRPGRYKLYDRLKLKVSLKTMNIIIYTVAGLLIIVLIIGIFGK